jgi:hypothetical protein
LKQRKKGRIFGGICKVKKKSYEIRPLKQRKREEYLVGFVKYKKKIL